MASRQKIKACPKCKNQTFHVGGACYKCAVLAARDREDDDDEEENEEVGPAFP